MGGWLAEPWQRPKLPPPPPGSLSNSLVRMPAGPRPELGWPPSSPLDMLWRPRDLIHFSEGGLDRSVVVDGGGDPVMQTDRRALGAEDGGAWPSGDQFMVRPSGRKQRKKWMGGWGKETVGEGSR